MKEVKGSISKGEIGDRVKELSANIAYKQTMQGSVSAWDIITAIDGEECLLDRWTDEAMSALYVATDRYMSLRSQRGEIIGESIQYGWLMPDNFAVSVVPALRQSVKDFLTYSVMKEWAQICGESVKTKDAEGNVIEAGVAGDNDKKATTALANVARLLEQRERRYVRQDKHDIDAVWVECI